MLGNTQAVLTGVQRGGGVTYATWSTTDKLADPTLSNGNLTLEQTTGEAAVRSTISKSSGKWYWEVTKTSNTQGCMVGMSTAAETLDSLMYNEFAWSRFTTNQSIYHDTAVVPSSPAIPVSTQNSVSNYALDADNGLFWIGQDGVYANGATVADIAAGLKESFSSVDPAVFAHYSGQTTGNIWTANFGASAFANTVPSGFNPGLYE